MVDLLVLRKGTRFCSVISINVSDPGDDENDSGHGEYCLEATDEALKERGWCCGSIWRRAVETAGKAATILKCAYN